MSCGRCTQGFVSPALCARKRWQILRREFFSYFWCLNRCESLACSEPRATFLPSLTVLCLLPFPFTIPKQLVTTLQSLSRVAASLAKQSEHLGLHDYAARLHDLSGDDYRLISFLSALAQGQRHPYGNVDIASTADAAAQQLRALQSSGTSAMGERVSNGEDDGPTGKFFRRSSLLAGVSRIPQVYRHDKG